MHPTNEKFKAPTIDEIHIAPLTVADMYPHTMIKDDLVEKQAFDAIIATILTLQPILYMV